MGIISLVMITVLPELAKELPFKTNKKRRLYKGQPPYLEDFNEKSHYTHLIGGGDGVCK